MSRPCPRCGFPNGADARRCRACRAVLDGGPVRLTPKLRAVLDRARHQGSPEHRVDRLPGRIPSPQQIRARREALASERKSGLDQLRRRLDHLDRNRAVVPASDRIQRRPPERPTTLAVHAEPVRSPRLPAAQASEAAAEGPQPVAAVAAAPEAIPRPKRVPQASETPLEVPEPVVAAAPELAPSPELVTQASEASPEALEPVVAAAPELAPVPEFVPANEEGSTDVGRSVELAFVPAPASVVDSSASKRTALEMAAAAYVNEEDEGVPEPSASEVATAILDEKTTPPTNAMDLESPVSAAPDLEDDFRSAEPFLLSDLNPPPASPSVDDFMSGEPFLVSDVPADVPEESLLRAVVDGVEDHGGQQRSEEADPVRVTEWGEISWNEQHGALESSDLGIDAENDEVEGGAEEQSSGSELGRFGWRRTAACIVDLLLPAGALYLAVAAPTTRVQLPPEEWVARLLLGESSGLGFGLALFIGTWLFSIGLSCFWLQRSLGMRIFGLTWRGASRTRLLLRLPLSLLCLLPFGVGITWAWVDGNSRTVADHLLGLRWQGPGAKALEADNGSD